MVFSAALALAKFIPGAISLFSEKRGKDAQSAMEAVEKVAENITGKTGDEAIAAIESDPNLALEFKKAVMADSHVSEQLELEDKKSAREMYKVHHEMADRIAHMIMKWNLPTILLLVVFNVAGVYIAEYYKLPSGMVAIISNLIGVVIGQLLAERQNVVGFLFGSSAGSKAKDK